MGTPTPYQPHKLFVAALFGAERTYESVLRLITRDFGSVDAALPPQPFDFSTYYDGEMGAGLRRTLFSIEALVDPSALASLKQTANRIEHATTDTPGSARVDTPDGRPRRTVNLDPGLLSLSRVILATTKASAHRIPLRDGLYAEITLLYRRGRYTAMEWTYPDYRSEAFLDWLGAVRRTYHEQLRRIDPSYPWRL